MKTMGTVLVMTLLVGSGLSMRESRALPPGVRCTDVQRCDLSVPGRELVQVRIDFDPGVVAPAHRHPGEEIVHVIEGSLEYRIAGKPPVTLEAGDVLVIPAEAPHSVSNVGSRDGAVLGTYLVETGKPLVVAVR